jgi:hypothetical protein
VEAVGVRKGSKPHKVQLSIGAGRGIGDLGVVKFVAATTMEKRSRIGERIVTIGGGDN